MKGRGPARRIKGETEAWPPPGGRGTTFDQWCLGRGHRVTGLRFGSTHRFREDPTGLLPEVIVHVTRRFEAHGLLGYLDGFVQGDRADDLLHLGNAVRRDAQLS